MGEEKKRSEVLGVNEEPASSKRGMGGPPVYFKESGHLAHIFIVAGASCSRPSMERPAPCFAKPPFLRKETEDEDKKASSSCGWELQSQSVLGTFCFTFLPANETPLLHLLSFLGRAMRPRSADYRRRRSCGQDARAPLWGLGAAEPHRPTEV